MNYNKNNIVMKVTDVNGFFTYEIVGDQIVIDELVVFEKRKGTGSKLLNIAKDIVSKYKLSSIGLYAEPIADGITQENLIDFYKSNGFELDKDDIDGKLMVWD